MRMNISDLFVNEVNLIYQQDNDPKHTSILIRKYFEDYGIVKLDWPSNSPDLNPIENVWHLLKLKMSKIIYETKEEFIKCIEESWKEIKVETIDNIIKSMPNRLHKLIENNGDRIDY